jgi:hypothetical protein
LNVDPAQQAQTNGPFWKTGFVLWVLALCGVFLVLPYVATLENKALAAAAARTHLEVGELLAISVVQTAILLAIAVILGQWAVRQLGLGTPLIAALLAGRSGPERSLSTLLLALALGIATALALMMLDHWVFAPFPAVAELIHNAESGSARPSAWQGFLASFYGAVTEEILMRFGFLSLLALAFRTLARMCGANREIALPTDVFWAANIVHSGAIRTGTLAGDRSDCATVGGARRPRHCPKRDCGPRIWRIVQALRIGVGDDIAFWRRHCRPCRRWLILRHTTWRVQPFGA